MSWFLLLLCIVGSVAGCHPECSWQCDDPVCLADVVSVCDPVNCTYQCEEPNDTITCIGPICDLVCPPDQCESDACPACEIQCEILECTATDDADINCTSLCAEPQCSWYGTTPTDCPEPVCELVCETPACAGDAPPVTPPSSSGMGVGSIVGLCVGLIGPLACLGGLYILAEIRQRRDDRIIAIRQQQGVMHT